MQSNQQNHSKLLTVILAGVASIGFATAASAAGGNLRGTTNVGADAQIAPAPGTSMGGAANGRLGASADLDSNAQWKDTASQGIERAQDRADTAQERASTQADEMKTQAEEMRTQAQSQADDMKAQAQEMNPGVRAETGITVDQAAKNKR